jgi:hypothetical protein
MVGIDALVVSTALTEIGRDLGASIASPTAFSQGFAAANGVAAMLSLTGAADGLFLPASRREPRIALASGPALTPTPRDQA